MDVLRVGVDIDDVLYSWTKHAHAACEAAGITNGAQITQWSFHHDYKITSDELWRTLYSAYGEGMLLQAPYEGVAALLGDLRSEGGHTVHLVTARGSEPVWGRLVREHTIEWLERYAIPHDSLSFTKDKTLVNVDVFLDDSIANVTALRAAGTPAYLHTQPHNMSDTTLPRVSGLHEFCKIVEAGTTYTLDRVGCTQSEGSTA